MLDKITLDKVLNVIKFWCFQLDEETYKEGFKTIQNGFVSCSEDLPSVRNRRAFSPVHGLGKLEKFIVFFDGVSIENGFIINISNIAVLDTQTKEIVFTAYSVKTKIEIFD